MKCSHLHRILLVVAVSLALIASCHLDTANARDASLISENAGYLMQVHEKDGIIKPYKDTREYKYITLPNKMRVLLIYDKLTNESSASIDVNIGAMADQKGIYGLTHLMEHMLKGSSVSGSPQAFERFILENGGETRGRTGSANTSYSFSVPNDAFETGLKMFKDCIEFPLLDQKVIDNEIENIQREVIQGQVSSHMSWMQVLKAVSNPQCPYNHNFYGCKQIFLDYVNANNLNLLEELRDYHNTWYSSDIMTGVVISNKPLRELEQLVTGIFRQISNKDAASKKKEMASFFEIPMFTPEYLGTLTYTKVATKEQSVFFLFPLPSRNELGNKQPWSYLVESLSALGPNCFMTRLREEGLAEEVIGNNMRHDTTNILNISFLAGEKDVTLDVIRKIGNMLFLYVNYLQTHPINMHILNDEQTYRTILFNTFVPPSFIKYASLLSSHMHLYDKRNCILGQNIPVPCTEQDVKNFLSYITVENCQVHVVKNDSSISYQMIEPVLGARYHTAKIPADIYKSWKEIRNLEKDKLQLGIDEYRLSLPKKNVFFPTTTRILPLDPDASDVPKLVKPHKNYVNAYNKDIINSTKIYYKQDNKFREDRCVVFISISSPYISRGPREYLSAVRALKMQKVAMFDIVDQGELAGLHYDVIDENAGQITFRITGFGDKFSLYLKKLGEGFSRKDKFTQEEYNMFLQRSYEAIHNTVSRMHTMSRMSSTIEQYVLDPFPSPEERLQIMYNLKRDDIITSKQEMFKDAKCQVVFVGNAKSADIIDGVVTFLKNIGVTYTKSYRNTTKSLLMQPITAISLYDCFVPNSAPREQLGKLDAKLQVTEYSFDDVKNLKDSSDINPLSKLPVRFFSYVTKLVNKTPYNAVATFLAGGSDMTYKQKALFSILSLFSALTSLEQFKFNYANSQSILAVCREMSFLNNRYLMIFTTAQSSLYTVLSSNIEFIRYSIFKAAEKKSITDENVFNLYKQKTSVVFSSVHYSVDAEIDSYVRELKYNSTSFDEQAKVLEAIKHVTHTDMKAYLEVLWTKPQFVFMQQSSDNNETKSKKTMYQDLIVQSIMHLKRPKATAVNTSQNFGEAWVALPDVKKFKKAFKNERKTVVTA